MIEIVRAAWGWIGLDPDEIVAQNEFGNLIVRDIGGVFWRICPEELSCEIIAASAAEYSNLTSDKDFTSDWEMTALVDVARTKCEELSSER